MCFPVRDLVNINVTGKKYKNSPRFHPRTRYCTFKTSAVACLLFSNMDDMNTSFNDGGRCNFPKCFCQGFAVWNNPTPPHSISTCECCQHHRMAHEAKQLMSSSSSGYLFPQDMCDGTALSFYSSIISFY